MYSSEQKKEYGVVDGKCILEINSVTYEDSGDYRCTSDIEQLCEFELVITSPPPKIRQGLVWNSEENQNVTFDCHSKGRESNISILWVDSTGQELTSYTNGTFREHSETNFRNDSKTYEVNSTLTFVAIYDYDKFNFTCLVKNDDYSIVQTTSIQLNIINNNNSFVTAVISGTLAAIILFTIIGTTYWFHFREILVNTRTPSTVGTKVSVPTTQIGKLHMKEKNKIEISQPNFDSEIDYMDTHSHIWENFGWISLLLRWKMYASTRFYKYFTSIPQVFCS